MLREIRRIEKKGKAGYIRNLQYAGLVGKYINDRGYVCYDPQEVKEFLKGRKIGRPPKINKQGE
jgi:hypothetical protein